MERIKQFLKTRRGITVLTVVGAALLLGSYLFPYWGVFLKAPQYPEGLRLTVYMSHVVGDVDEVNLLNHYIGMGKLNEAAEFERRYALFGLLALSIGA
jgi:copper chaperone NosL